MKETEDLKGMQGELEQVNTAISLKGNARGNGERKKREERDGVKTLHMNAEYGEKLLDKLKSIQTNTNK